jgi:uncharacterized membrane protein YfcA
MLKRIKERSVASTRKWAKARQSILGTVMGIAAGSFGVSGGTPIASYLTTYEHLPPSQAVGTGLAVVAIMSLSGTLTHLFQSHINFELLLLLGGGAIFGAYAGAKLTQRINQRVLITVLSVLTLATAIGFFFKE